jgi:methylase of polypeptide subunit release factors
MIPLRVVQERLEAGPSPRVIVIGCGTGADVLALASAYPLARVVGIDPDDGAIAAARREAGDAGLTSRVRFEVADIADAAAGAGYDVVVACDPPGLGSQPAETLRRITGLATTEGTVLVWLSGPYPEIEQGG